MLNKFQSTRPIRGATVERRVGVIGRIISIHAPHTGRDHRLFCQRGSKGRFQSTRPIRGATGFFHFNGMPFEFQSTRPIRGATTRLFPIWLTERISIHAPHTGRDPLAVVGSIFGGISIHAPHTGRDLQLWKMQERPLNFNPRAPYGARPQTELERKLREIISIHAPHTGRDSKNA